MVNLVKKTFKWYFNKYSELYEKGYVNPQYMW